MSQAHRFDADEEVQQHGRSAVLRRVVEEYLRRPRASRIAASYRKAYGGHAGLGPDFAGWEDEDTWPEQ